VLDYDAAAARIGSTSVEAIMDAAEARGWRIEMVLETHAHADHLSGARLIAARTGAWIGIGALITEVQAVFVPMFGADDVLPEGRDFDRLLHDGETVPLGNLAFTVLHTPGHTAACVSFRIADAVFIGDTLFMPDYGTARTDFPGGDAHALYRSIRRLLALPDATRLFLCHDYKGPGRTDFAWETTVGAQRQSNVHAHDGIAEAAFVKERQARDTTLAPPRLLRQRAPGKLDDRRELRAFRRADAMDRDDFRDRRSQQPGLAVELPAHRRARVAGAIHQVLEEVRQVRAADLLDTSTLG
jgi:glyoxylase-like metal-dependent hydrolase (beta-lactamase superfamily II)